MIAAASCQPPISRFCPAVRPPVPQWTSPEFSEGVSFLPQQSEVASPEFERSVHMGLADGTAAALPFLLREVADRIDRDCPARRPGAAMARLLLPL